MEQGLYNNGYLDLYFENYGAGLGSARRSYIKYKNGIKANVDDEELLSFNILSLLERLGFSVDLIGTYLYKDVIIKISNYLLSNDANKDVYNNLLSDLKNKYSQFYVDIARNELDMGITTFHNYINEAVSKQNSLKGTRVDTNLVYQIFDKPIKELDFATQAFILGNYVHDNYINISLRDTKKKKLVI